MLNNEKTMQQLCQDLKLTFIRDNNEAAISDAERSSQNHSDFLRSLLLGECERRLNNGIARRMTDAKFPVKKYLTDFDRSKYDKDFEKKFEELETLNFINTKENIILIGTPGAGKSHYSTALGIAACLKGRSVLFVSVPNLIIELKEAMTNHQITIYRRKFEKYDLVILDELGYISFDKPGSELLFNLLSSRNDKGSIIITTNLTFERWGEVFGDTTLTGALVDRLAHKAHILDISREKGGRLEETIEWLAKTNN